MKNNLIKFILLSDDNAKTSYLNVLKINNDLFIFKFGAKHTVKEKYFYNFDYTVYNVKYLEENAKNIKGIFLFNVNYDNFFGLLSIVNKLNKKIPIYISNFHKKILSSSNLDRNIDVKKLNFIVVKNKQKLLINKIFTITFFEHLTFNFSELSFLLTLKVNSKEEKNIVLTNNIVFLNNIFLKENQKPSFLTVDQSKKIDYFVCSTKNISKNFNKPITTISWTIKNFLSSYNFDEERLFYILYQEDYYLLFELLSFYNQNHQGKKIYIFNLSLFKIIKKYSTLFKNIKILYLNSFLYSQWQDTKNLQDDKNNIFILSFPRNNLFNMLFTIFQYNLYSDYKFNKVNKKSYDDNFFLNTNNNLIFLSILEVNDKWVYIKFLNLLAFFKLKIINYFKKYNLNYKVNNYIINKIISTIKSKYFLPINNSFEDIKTLKNLFSEKSNVLFLKNNVIFDFCTKKTSKVSEKYFILDNIKNYNNLKKIEDNLENNNYIIKSNFHSKKSFLIFSKVNILQNGLLYISFYYSLKIKKVISEINIEFLNFLPFNDNNIKNKIILKNYSSLIKNYILKFLKNNKLSNSNVEDIKQELKNQINNTYVYKEFEKNIFIYFNIILK